jgi:pantetheine-phosphate adenylyltransferase
MKIAFYPGSFNPWHEGHEDILAKALKVFDKVIILRLTNSEKKDANEELQFEESNNVEFYEFKDMMLNIAIGNALLHLNIKDAQYAVIRGLRNSQDLEYEKAMQYWNEDLGLAIPTFYIMSDRKLVHISSSAIRAIRKFPTL